MGLARIRSVALVGVEGHLVEVEAHLADGLPAFSLVGLPDTALSEARGRVRAAVDNSDVGWPSKRLTVGLSPATLRKAGSHFDLAIAIAILAATEVVPRAALDRLVLLGELGLDGRVRAIRGTLPAVLAAATAGASRFIVPEVNMAEARLVDGVEVVGARSLRQVIAWLRGEEIPEEPPDGEELTAVEPAVVPIGPQGDDLDLSDVLGQAEARKAAEVAAAGGHHVFLEGPPGAGKTMLAERIPGLLPSLEPAEALEVTAIHSVAGTLPPEAPLLTRPPFCDPHPSATLAAMVGGGTGLARPGAVSLAHRGLLFIDEVPEMRPTVLDALRQPLEHGAVVIARASGTTRFPASFQLVLAANPCPCGNNFGRGMGCTCTPQTRMRYRGRVSGPIRDRIDIVRQVLPVTRAELLADRAHVESTATVAGRVAEARDRQRRRYADTPWLVNAQVSGGQIRRHWPPSRDASAPLERQLATGQLSARGADRVLRLAWTLADLTGADRPGRDEVHQALALRLGDGTGAATDIRGAAG